MAPNKWNTTHICCEILCVFSGFFFVRRANEGWELFTEILAKPQQLISSFTPISSTEQFQLKLLLFGVAWIRLSCDCVSYEGFQLDETSYLEQAHSVLHNIYRDPSTSSQHRGIRRPIFSNWVSMHQRIPPSADLYRVVDCSKEREGFSCKSRNLPSIW